MKLEFPRHIFETKLKLSSFIKIRPVGAQLFQADGKTDGHTYITALIAGFRNSANAPETGNNSGYWMDNVTLLK